ncbi:MAG: exodeoxyribonuclease V subunit beta [Luteimonas sp.]|nr:exodeoxyribonuclease V subunit beta [Luteimonas sp.]
MSDAYLALPLRGVHTIEASAGTGKTFTLATLVLRLVVEETMQVGEILAVTFTEAATQELRARIRARLLLAQRIAADDSDDDASPEAVLTRAVIDAHLAASGESRNALRRRLRTAADGIDLSAIFTIHGFCARVLREHALESGQGFDVPELLANDATLREGIAADLWRAHGCDAAGADDLSMLWPEGPQALARDLSPLVREPVLLPAPAPSLPDPTPGLHAAGEALAAGVRAHGDDFRAALLAAVDGKVLHGGSYKREWIDALFDALDDWCAAGDPGLPFAHEKLPQLQRETLLLRTSKAGQGRTPDSPLCDAVAQHLAVWAQVEAWRESRRVALLHRLRDDARKRIALHKRQSRVQTYDDLIDRVADALDGPHADALAARLRAQYKVALVDEFQDTDPRQWRIFDRVFGAHGDAPALFVIGDPKQAIYGFRGGDVETYLDAKASADDAPPLSQNFRSRPSVLRAIEALYAQAGERAFVDPRIQFHPVEPGGNRDDADYQRNGTSAPALTLWRAPAPDSGQYKDGRPKPYPATRSRELATEACVAAIHAVLDDARNGHASIGGRPVQPGDIAVLVRTHHEATRIREALAAAGIPAVAAGRQSLFAADQAHEVHAVLLALLHGADDGRLRTALATVLIGVDARRIAMLDDDGDALRGWQMAALGWRERLQRGGPLALIGDLCAQHATRLLDLRDGERRLTNYLQLAELLQEAQQRALGLHGMVDWLARAIAEASADDDTQLLRLESDARRVQVVTLHKSKGLEYPLVFLPFAGIGGKARSPGNRVVVHGDAGRVLHWKLQPDTSGWEDAKQAWTIAGEAEDARLLYVGLTRARDALWLASGAFYNHAQSPQSAMVADAQMLVTDAGGAIAIDDALPPATLPWLPPDAEGDVPDARVPARALDHDWWVYSFTQLAHADAGNDASSAATQPVPGGRDEPANEQDDDAIVAGEIDPRFGGTRFGVVLHDVLEHADFAAWQGWHPGDDPPGDERAKIVDALGRGGYAATDIDDGVAVLVPMAGHTLTVTLPEGTTLAALPATQRRAEIEFQFALAPTQVDALLALLHRHGLLRERRAFGLRRKLEGLMTGLIDLTYQHDGRWYVLDYKSNRLPGYGPAQLDAAMAHSEYHLQALIYTLALHRWLRFRLGDGYDYARDFGGIRYLFCRGLEPHGDTARGVFAHRFAPELVHALDALFSGQAQGAAA